MKSPVFAAVAAVALIVGHQPAAAGMSQSESTGEVRRGSAAFAGVTIKLSQGKSNRITATGRLALGFMGFDQQGFAVHSRKMLPSSALELGFSDTGRAQFFVGGAELSDRQRRLGMAGGEGLVLTILGLAAAAFVVAEVTKDDKDKEKCLLPEQELCGD